MPENVLNKKYFTIIGNLRKDINQNVTVTVQ